MKIFLSLGLLVSTCAVLLSCGDDATQSSNAEGFGAIETELKSEFGDKAYYTELTIINVEGIGNVVNVTVTKDPKSLKMEEWNFSQNAWKQNADIKIEVPEGSVPEDFMFQLNDKINLSKLGELVEKSMKQLKSEKNIEEPILEMAFVKFPKNGDLATTEYTVKLQPKNGGTSFTFYYDLSGEFIKMDY